MNWKNWGRVYGGNAKDDWLCRCYYGHETVRFDKDRRLICARCEEAAAGKETTNVVAVSMAPGSWQAILELILESAVRVHQEGDQEGADAILTRLVPVLACAAPSKRLERTERAVRARVGSYVTAEVRSAAGRLVRVE